MGLGDTEAERRALGAGFCVAAVTAVMGTALVIVVSEGLVGLPAAGGTAGFVAGLTFALRRRGLKTLGEVWRQARRARRARRYNRRSALRST